jgi:Amt family ammonium transporter
MKKNLTRAAVGAAALFVAVLPRLALAQDEIDSGDTAWMLTSTALVLYMTIPVLSLFYAGMVRAKNALSVMMQCFTITCLMTILWTVYLYSFAFGDDIGGFMGGFNKVLMSVVKADSFQGTIP